jgi:peptidoglycan/LPS O-acetylase OafA/YrhL
VKRARASLPTVCWAVLGASLAVFCLVHYGAFGTHEWKRFAEQLKFHYMAAGGLCAWWLHRRRNGFLGSPAFASRAIQLVLFAMLLDFYLTSFIHWGWLGEELLQVVLYCWLIVTVAANPLNVVPVGKRAFDYLGTISYGIYMLHMFAVYAVSFLFQHTSWWHGRMVPYCLAFYALVFGLTVLLAHLSYRWIEQPFLSLKDRRFSAPATPSPSPPAPAPSDAAAATAG